MNEKATKQYTIRRVPPSVDRALKKRAREENKSLNSLLLAAIQQAAGVYQEQVIYDDLDPLAGSWVKDRVVDKALKEERRIHRKDWE